MGYSFGEVSNKICEEAVEAGCPDNVTLVVVDLNAYYTQFQNLSVNDVQEIDLKMIGEKGEPAKKSKIIAFAEDSFNKVVQRLDKDGFAIPMPSLKRAQKVQRNNSSFSMMSVNDSDFEDEQGHNSSTMIEDETAMSQVRFPNRCFFSP